MKSNGLATKDKLRGFLLTLSFALVSTSLWAANIFVDQDATGSNNGNSWANAYTDLPNALASASSGDLIFVAEGVYKPTSGITRTVSFNIPSGVTIYGGFGGTETAINQRDIKNNLTVLSGNIGSLGTNSDNSYRLLTFINNAETSILDGFRLQGGNSDDPVIYNKGAAVYGINSSVQLRNCEIRNCEGITNLIHLGNGDYLLENVLMHNCTSEGTLMGAASAGSVFDFRNVTFAQNASTNSAPMFDTFFVEANFYNCIIYNTAQFASPITGGWNPTFDHCLIGGGLSSIPEGSGTNIIDEIPQFMDVNNEDFSLQETSPAIDAGLDSHVQTDIDAYGNFRFSGESVDLGAIERSTVNYPIFYVDQDANGANDGSSWENAFTDLQDGLSAALSGDHIWVAEGVYKPTTSMDRTIEFVLQQGVSLMGGFAGFEVDPYQRDINENLTTLSGNIGNIIIPDDNSYHVLRVAGSAQAQSIDGFVIQGGNANGTSTDGNGGAIFVSGSQDLTVSNCLFQNNLAIVGACLQLLTGTNSTVENCYFLNNEGLYVAVAQTATEFTMKNSIMVANTAFRLISVSPDGFVTTEHCTIADNASDGPWGGNGEMSCANSIIWNSGTEAFSTGTTIHNVITDLGVNDLGVITEVSDLMNVDPNFLDPANLDYRIDSSSPAFDAGDPALSSQSRDLLGIPRPYNGLPDIGCYEAEYCIQIHNFCTSAEMIPVYYTDHFNTTRCADPGSYETMTCNADLTNNVWYRFEGTASGAISIVIDPVYNYGSPADLRFAVYEGLCILTPEPIACVNNSGPDETESGTITGLVDGDDYWLRVEVGPGEEASFNVRIEVAELGCPGDFDMNSSINSGDLLTFLSEFGCTSGCIADMDGNGEVNSIDLLEFLTVFGTTCP